MDYCIKILVGSHNYNLNTEDSDKDYKAFIVPSFDDLYYNRDYNKSIITEKEDIEIKSIKTLPKLLSKANSSYLELLFSQDSMIVTSKIREYWGKLLNLRNDIVKMNLLGFYEGILGTIHNKIIVLHKGTSGTQHLVDKYGYDTKQLMHIFRLHDLIYKFADNNFNNYGKCLYYSDEVERQELLDIKNGSFQMPLEGIINRAAEVALSVTKLKDKFYNNFFNDELRAYIEKLTFELIRENINKNF